MQMSIMKDGEFLDRVRCIVRLNLITPVEIAHDGKFASLDMVTPIEQLPF